MVSAGIAYSESLAYSLKYTGGAYNYPENPRYYAATFSINVLPVRNYTVRVLQYYFTRTDDFCQYID